MRTYCALGSAWEAGTRLLWWKPFILGPEDPPDQWTPFWNQAHQKHAHPNEEGFQKFFKWLDASYLKLQIKNIP